MSGFLLLTISMIITGSALAGGVLGVKVLNQRERDRRRTSYVLNFPADLDAERVLAFLRATSRTLNASRLNLTASQTMVFELLATDSGITHRLRVPWQKEDDIIPQLRALAPGISATPDLYPPDIGWKYAVEIGETNKSRPLSIPSSKDVAASILASVQPLKEGEAVLMQWVVTPSAQQKMPEQGSRSNEFHWTNALIDRKSSDEISERRSKLSEPNMMGVLRVSARANTVPRSKHLIDRIKTSYNATNTTSNRWYRRTAPVGNVIDRITRAASLTIWPAQLSASELVAFLGWPIGAPNVSGLPQGTARQIPVTSLVPGDGIPVGHANFPGQERDVAIGYEQALMHTWIGGKTGVGKSTLMGHQARRIMQDGKGLIVLETEGNLYEAVLASVPKERVDDVVILDLTDALMPVGFNVLDQGNPDVMIDGLIELFEHLYDTSLWADEYITNGLKTLVEIGGLAFTDLLPLLNPQTTEEIRWADSITRQVKDTDLRRWWTGHENRGKRDQQQRASPVLSRIAKLVSRKELRNVFGQRTSSFQIADILRDHKILLINLKGVSSGTAKLVGTLIMTAIQHATITTKKDVPTFLMMDEFGDMMDIPVNIERMFAQFRKHNVGLIVAAQNMSQLKPDVRDGVITNARNKITFAANPDDAKTILKGMNNNHLATTDIVNLRAFEGIADVMTVNGNSGPFSIGTKPPARPSGYGGLAASTSRSKYGRPISEVRAEMSTHTTGRPEDSDRPGETGDGWD